MTIAVVQMNPDFGRIRENIRRAISLMESTRAELYVLPELFNAGYNFGSRDEVAAVAEKADDGPTSAEMQAFAHDHRCSVVYGFVELSNGSLYNSAALVSPSGFEGLYRKVHLFDRENLFFEKGNLGFPIFRLPSITIGMMICFDWIFPESARTLAAKGAQLIAHPSNLVLPHCPEAMVTRCLENRVFAATADRIGAEDRHGHRLAYIGKSEIVSPHGNILVRLSGDKEEVGVVDVDPTLADEKRINEFNDVLRDRRTEFYS
jgi:predicted amidohydrolase